MTSENQTIDNIPIDNVKHIDRIRAYASKWRAAMRACRAALTKLAIDKVVSSGSNATLTKADLRSTARAAFNRVTDNV